MASAEETAGLTDATSRGQDDQIHAQRLRRVTSIRAASRMALASADFNALVQHETSKLDSPQASSPGLLKDPGAMFDDYAFDEDDLGNKVPRDRILRAEFEEMMRTEFGDVRDDDILSLWDSFLANENAKARTRNLPQQYTLSKAEFVQDMLEHGITDYSHASTGSSDALDFSDVDLQEASERAVRQRQADVRCSQPSTWYIHPDGAFRVTWDFWLLILIFYVAFCVPLRIGFDLVVRPWNVWFFIDIVADATFLVDLVLNFFTGYMDSFGLRVSRGSDVAMNYLGWGPQKAFTVVPATSAQSPREHEADSSRRIESVDVKFQKEEEDGDATALLNLITCCCRPCFRGGLSGSCRRCALQMTRCVRMPLRGWFVVDFLSCLPVAYIALAVDAASDGIDSDGSVEGGTIASSTRAIRILRLLRLAKLLRLARIGRLLEKYCEDLREFYQAMAVFRAVWTTVAMAHWTACAWHFLGVQGTEDCPPASTEGCTWFEKSTLEEMGSHADRLWDRYAVSLYWSATTLTTVGYGDITPVTSTEMVFAVFIEILGTCTFAYTAGTLSSVIMESKLDPRIQEYNEKMPKIKEYLRGHRVPRSDRIRIRAYFDRAFHEHKAIDERTVLDLMPGGIKGAMARNVVKTIYNDTYNLLASSKLFFSLTDLALVDLIIRLEPIRFRGPCREFPDGEEIIRQGQTCADIYLITSGCCRSISRADPLNNDDATYDGELEEGDMEMLLKKGEVFGERSALELGGGVDRMDSTHTVLARGQLMADDVRLTGEALKTFLRRRWDEGTEASFGLSMTTVQVLSAANLTSFLDDFGEYKKKLPALVRVQIEKQEHRKRIAKLKGLCPNRAQAEAAFSSIIETWAGDSGVWEDTAGKELERRMKHAGGELLKSTRRRNDRDCLGIVQVKVYLKPWRRWLISTTLPEKDYMELLSEIFDPDGDRNITRDEFWHGINELKQPKHFKRKVAVPNMESQMEAVSSELTMVKREVNNVQEKLHREFTGLQEHLQGLTAHFEQFIGDHRSTD